MKKNIPKSEDRSHEDDVHKKIESQRFDKIFRQNMPVIFQMIMEKIFGLQIVDFTDLKDKLQTTKQLEVDALRKVTDVNGKSYIVHLETQTRNDGEIVVRLLEYRSMLKRIHKLLVMQYVLYLGEEPMNMPNYIDEPNLHFEYTLIDFSTIPYEWFLQSDHPEEQILAILGNLGGKDPVQLVEQILTNIENQPTIGEKNKYFNQLRVLNQLRSFTDTKKMEEIMLKAASFFKEERDPFYKRGEVKGEEKKSYEFVTNLVLNTDFNDAKIASLAVVTVEFVQKIRASLAKQKKN
ncbi:hypothetical protein SAMN05216436_102145 [bacterium A37T11]|nr:hypothetical protein SAMN05216436_102145 [bacterium A37T11]